MSRSMKLNSIVALAVMFCMPQLLQAKDNDSLGMEESDCIGDWTRYPDGGSDCCFPEWTPPICYNCDSAGDCILLPIVVDEDRPSVLDAPTTDQVQDQPEDTTPPWLNDAVESLEGFGTLEVLGTPVAELDPQVVLPLMETMIDPDLIKACLVDDDDDGEPDGYIVQEDGGLLCCFDELGCLGGIDGEIEVLCDGPRCLDGMDGFLELLSHIGGDIHVLQVEPAENDPDLNSDDDGDTHFVIRRGGHQRLARPPGVTLGGIGTTP